MHNIIVIISSNMLSHAVFHIATGNIVFYFDIPPYLHLATSEV